MGFKTLPSMIKGPKKKELYRYKIGSICKVDGKYIGKVVCYICPPGDSKVNEIAVLEMHPHIHDDNCISYNADSLNKAFNPSSNFRIENHLGEPMTIPEGIYMIRLKNNLEKIIDECDRVKVKIKLPRNG
jgi:hypothetical protein